MKKTGFILIAVAAIVIGFLVGTLNSASVSVDLLWFQFELPLGLAILSGFSLGLVVGISMLYMARIVPLRLQLRKARVALSKKNEPDQDKLEPSTPDA